MLMAREWVSAQLGRLRCSERTLLGTIGWLVGVTIFVTFIGLPLGRDTVLVIMILGLLVVSSQRGRVTSVLADWLPFALVLVLYDFVQATAITLNMPTMWAPQIEFDSELLGGTAPSVWLQEHFSQARPTWYDAAATLVYLSFFIVPYAAAAGLWLRSRNDFRSWALRFVAMSFLASAVFILIPSGPPWAAALCNKAQVAVHSHNLACFRDRPIFAPLHNLLPPFAPSYAGAGNYVQRLSARGLIPLHLRIAGNALGRAQGQVDVLAAVPSLHAGVTMLLLIYFWARVGIWWRSILALYNGAMALALVYTGEHYVFDILSGWVLAVLVSTSANVTERRLALRRRSVIVASPSTSRMIT